MTGAAVEALNAAGFKHTSVQEEAFAFLNAAQNSNGGFPEYKAVPEEQPNVASTAWAVEAMWSAGETPESPLGYLASMQQEDGHIRYKANEEQNGVWMTAQVAPALAGEYLPVPPVPPEERSPPVSNAAGAGEESAHAGAGVITGGGGKGAPLFSRP